VSAALLEFLGASKWYGQIAALNDVSFRIEPGVVGLVGQNGAGKSSLIKLAAGLLRPTHGEVLVAGKDARRRASRARIGFCPDLDRSYESSTGRDFVAWMLRLHGVGGRAARERAAAVLDELGLGAAMHRPIRTYSKGMRQRVKLGQALAHSPEIVLLDEPLTGLDPVARHQLGERIRALGAAGRAVLVSSHVLHELQAVADRYLLLHRSRLVADGTLRELRAQLSGRPQRVQVQAADPRALAARLIALPQVQSLQFGPDQELILEVRGSREFFTTLTAIGAETSAPVVSVATLDDSLEAVFGYLVA
jgi:ABC-2 type transport system ATP-binding protein